jgi:hypothetical protein
VLQIWWLLANPLWTHGIGESRSKTITIWLYLGAAAANQSWWFITKPYTGSLPHPSSYRISCLPFWSLKFLLLLTAIVASTAKNQLCLISWVRQLPIKAGG